MPKLDLLAYNIEDVVVIASHLENSYTKLQMMKLDQKARRFAIMMIRQDRIRQIQNKKNDKMWKTALVVNHVIKVSKNHNKQINKQQEVKLLTIYAKNYDEKSKNVKEMQKKTEIILVFEEELMIRIYAECIDIFMQDIEKI